MPILIKLFPKTAKEGTLPNSFYEATITLIAKPDKDNTKKENYRPISLLQKSSTKFQQTEFSNCMKQFIHHDQVGLIPRMKGFFNICKSM